MDIKRRNVKISNFKTISTKFKKAFILFLYFSMIMLLITSFNGYTITDKFIKLIQMTSFILPIYLIVSNAFGIRNKLPFIKQDNKLKKSLGIVTNVFIFLILFSTVVGVSSNFLSSEQQRINLANISSSQDGETNYLQTTINDTQNKEAVIQDNTKDNEVIKTIENLEVHFIDVGQADSILVKQGSYSMLIDAGNNEDAAIIKDYINNQGITKLDYVVGTHVHEDHIGSMDDVIDTYDIGKILFPKQTSTTKTFEYFVLSVKNKGMKLYSPNVGEVFELGKAEFEIMAPNSTYYDDANDYSIVIKLKYGNNSFLLTGDAESISENEMLNKNLDLKSDVLKIGHHASKSSTSQEFLNKVNPKYAVISVGKNNSYGHPNQLPMDRLKNAGIPVFRTDEQGTIVAISDGQNITFNCKQVSYNFNSSSTSEKSSVSTSNTTSQQTTTNNVTTPIIIPAKTAETPVVSTPTTSTVYVTKTGKKYHTATCKYLSQSKISISLQDAKLKYTPCSVCNPPE